MNPLIKKMKEENDELNIRIPKKKLKNILTILIVIIIFLIATPRILSNISSALSFVGIQAEKFPVIFPNLASVGNFFFDESKDLTKSIGNNLASIGELLYTKKIEVPVEKIIGEEPLKIIIDEVGINSIIINPKNSDLETLETALKAGVVHYPESGLLGEDDNVYLFGHNTNIEIVRNQAYKALNGLKNLVTGNIIRIQSEKKEYLYSVISVEMKKDSNALIEFHKGEKSLTISTCNSLGEKEDRYIVKAVFVGSYPLIMSENQISNGTTQTKPATNNSSQQIVSTPIITPGQQTEKIENIVITPTTPPVIGKPDLKGEITEVGILNSNNQFVATTTLQVGLKSAVKFTISNIGGEKAEGWSFNMVLPTYPSYIYHSNSQENLRPNEKIEYILGFDKVQAGKNQTIILNVDPTGGLNEIKKDNNIIKKFVDIFE